jgi:hypothetical protein
MSETPSSPISEESWSFARSYATVFGDLPSSFSVVVRSLMNDFASTPTQMSSVTRYGVMRLLKSPTLYAPLFFVRSMLQDDQSSSTALIPEDQLAKEFSLIELAYLIGFLYLYRRAQSTCDQEEFAYISSQIAEDATLAIALGRAVPGVGGGTALMEATAPLLGLTCILKHDLPGFKEYRRTMKKTNTPWSTDWEVSRWGCSRVQIGTIVVQLLGFGVQRSNAFFKALSSPPHITPPNEEEFSLDVRMAAVWRASTQTYGKSPEFALPAKYYPKNADYQRVLARQNEYRISPPSPLWLNATKDDLPSPMSEPIDDGATQALDKN